MNTNKLTLLDDNNEINEFNVAIKSMYKYMDELIRYFLKEGFYFFSLNVNLIDYFKYCSGSKPLLEIDFFIKYKFNFISLFLGDIEFIDAVYGTLEYSEKGMPHFHCLVLIRKISPSPEGLIAHLNSVFTHSSIKDFQINQLKSFLDIKRFFSYMVKEFKEIHGEKDRHLLYCTIFSPLHESIHSIFIGNLQLDCCLIFIVPSLRIYCCNTNTDYRFYKDFLEKTKFNDIQGLNFGNIKKDSQKTLVELSHYINIYFKLNNMFMYKGNLYQKIKESKLSYKFLGDKEYIFSNLNTFLNYLCDTFKSLIRKDVITRAILILMENRDKFFRCFQSLSLTSIKEFNNNIMEFRDGIYLAQFNKFISHQDKDYDLSSIQDSYFTLRYYNYNYQHINSIYKKSRWYYYLKKQFDSEDRLQDFLSLFANFLFDELPNSSNKSKKKAIMTLGVSNSGKTSLISNIAMNVFGKENTGVLSNSNTFQLEQAQNKDTIIMDEVELSPSNRSNILKLSSGEALPVNIKHETTKFLTLTNKIIFSSNYVPGTLEFMEDKAFLNRINLIMFDNELDISSEDYERIDNEIPQILLLCNRTRFKNIKWNKHSTYISRVRKFLLESPKSLKITQPNNKKSLQQQK